jgi:HPt (histidine-containing phosphotransfer) domain-containing protein
MAVGIPGIDEAIFNDLLDGDEDLFETVLRTFVEKMPGSLAKLANPTQETLEDYRIIVHAVKGACAAICAEDLRKKAFDLEMRAKGGDLAGVQAGNGALIKEVEEMIEKSRDWLKNRSRG